MKEFTETPQTSVSAVYPTSQTPVSAVYPLDYTYPAWNSRKLATFDPTPDPGLPNQSPKPKPTAKSLRVAIYTLATLLSLAALWYLAYRAAAAFILPWLP